MICRDPCPGLRIEASRCFDSGYQYRCESTWPKWSLFGIFSSLRIQPLLSNRRALSRGNEARASLRSLLLLPILAGMLAGCESLAYYAQAASGQWSLLSRRQPIEEVIAAPDTSEALSSQLQLVPALRDFARESLQLPLNGQFLDYADLQRDYVVWNVLAAPELSFQAETWCFPLVGCVAYRGYFSASAAREFAGDLAVRGYDTHVAGVAAYSTLGWMHDPVLNTFVMLPEPRLADLIFHELAHQLLFIPGDTGFNESFATTVAREGVRRRLHTRGEPDQYANYLAEIDRENDFKGFARTLSRRTRAPVSIRCCC